MNDPHRRNTLNLVRELVEADRLDEAMEQLKALPDYQNDASEFKNRWSHLQDRSRRALSTDEEFQTQRNNLVHGIFAFLSRESSKLPPLRKEDAHASPFFLPQMDVANFVGREEELKHLHKILLNSQGSRTARVVGLTGSGGMGKTALAFHFAQVYRDSFPDGVIGMRVDNRDVDATAHRFAYHAGITIDNKQKLTAAEIMQTSFRERRMLLIFDNAEESTIRALHPGGDQCAVIVTTRNRQVLTSFGIPSPFQIDITSFRPEESINLFIQVLGTERVTQEIEATKNIHVLVGGLPLAIQIIASSLRDQTFTSLSSYGAILQNAKARLSYLHDPDDPDFNVRACFSLSLKYLDDGQIELFARLAACTPEGFSLQAVKAVAAQDDVSVRSGLGRLLRLSLLNDGNKPDRFVFHPLLFLFAKEIAEQKNLLTDAQARHIDYFIDYAEAHQAFSSNNFDALEIELNALLLTAQQLCNSNDPHYEFWFTLEPFFQSKGYWLQALKIIDNFLEVARTNNDFHHMTQFLLQKGQFLQLIGNLEEAILAFQQSESMAQDLGNHHSQAMVLNSLGVVYQRQGKLDEAILTFEQSLKLRDSDRLGRAMTLNSLGGVYQRQGKLDDAVSAFRQSLKLRENDKLGQAMVLNSLGSVYQRQGKLDEAVDAFLQSERLEEELGNQRGRAMILNSLGGVYQRQGKWDEAIYAFKESLALRENDKIGQAMVLNSLGVAYQRQGNFDEAIHYLQQSEKLERELGNQRGRAMALTSLGVAYQRQGNFDKAIQYLLESEKIESELNNRRGRAMVLNSLGIVYQRQGKYNEAIHAFQQNYDLWKDIGDKRQQSLALNSLGSAYERKGNIEEAVRYFELSLSMSRQMNDESHLARTYTVYGKALLEGGKLSEALKNLEIGFEMESRLANQRGIRFITPLLIRTLLQLGKLQLAQTYYNRALAIVPNDREIIKLKDKITEKAVVPNRTHVKAGRIKRIFYESNGYIYGFITQDDGEEDIYFNERQVGQDLLATITEGMAVMVEAESSPRGLRARRLWQKKA